MESSLNEYESTTKSDVETQTDYDLLRNRRDSSSQTLFDQKATNETQTIDIETNAHVGRNILRQEVVVEIPEKLLEKIQSKPLEPLQPLTELTAIQFGDTIQFNFVGAFLNFHNMTQDEIIKIQGMVECENFEVCQRAIYARRTFRPNFVMTA